MRMLSPLSTGFAWPRRALSPDLVGEMFEDLDRIADSLLRPVYAQTVGFQPGCDVNETNDHYLVTFETPGVRREDIKIEVKGNHLTIMGVRHREFRGESEGRFERTFILPQSVNTEKIEAQYEDGVLSVALPKAESAKGRTIQIQSGQPGFLSKLLGPKKDGPKELKDVKVS